MRRRNRAVSEPGDSAVLHASAVAVGGRGVLILGPSGAGKSGLALRMMALGAQLVADDRVVLRRAEAGLVASAPAALAGLIEARGVGILRVPAAEPTSLLCAVDLGEAPAARLPQPRKFVLLGAEVELLSGQGIPNLGSVLTVFVRSGGEAV